jgi:hypothetical protein
MKERQRQWYETSGGGSTRIFRHAQHSAACGACISLRAPRRIRRYRARRALRMPYIL